MAELIGALIAISATFVPSLTPAQSALLITRVYFSRFHTFADPLNEKSNMNMLKFIQLTDVSEAQLDNRIVVYVESRGVLSCVIWEKCHMKS